MPKMLSKCVEDLYEKIKSGEIKVSRKAPAHIRFWRDIDKDSVVHPTYGSCWIWIRGPYAHHLAYGAISVKGVNVRVHKFSYEMFYGKIECELQVLHRCDNPLCVNPNHLFLGTQLENQRDMVAKNRQAKGSSCGPSVLTEEDVLKIRYLYTLPNYSQRRLARLFKVSQCNIFYIVNRLHWRHI